MQINDFKSDSKCSSNDQKILALVLKGQVNSQLVGA